MTAKRKKGDGRDLFGANAVDGGLIAAKAWSVADYEAPILTRERLLEGYRLCVEGVLLSARREHDCSCGSRAIAYGAYRADDEPGGYCVVCPHWRLP